MRRKLLIIQIPCFNEEEQLPSTLAELPEEHPGFDRVEWQIIDDGSTDRTVEVARQGGVHHIVRLGTNRGLARAFMAGLEAALAAGADVIVNTDADNQYRAADIDKLVAPILSGEADVVLGSRPIQSIEHFSLSKKLLQRAGSAVVRSVSGVDVADSPSGFRAFAREAALRLQVFDRYTYTLETLIQAGQEGLRVLDVPVRVNPPTRPSRLIGSMGGYVVKSIGTITSAFLIYRPVRFFGFLSLLLFVPGAFLAIRYLWLAYVVSSEGAHVQSVIAAAVFGLSSLFMAVLGVTAHLLAINRRLLEEIRYVQRKRRTDADGRPAQKEDP